MRTKIAFDLDGVFIDKPPFIPKTLLEFLFRGTKYKKNKPYYRFPKLKLEQYIRKMSHYYLLRPPIKKNINFVKKLANNKKCELFIVSARYCFLENETKNWFKKRKINSVFKKKILNKKDQQPHIFKEKVLKKIKADIYVEDDKQIVNYLSSKLEKTKVLYLKKGKSLEVILNKK